MIKIFANNLIRFLVLGSLGLLAFSTFASAAPVVRQGSGANAAGLQAIVDLFRADLGGVNNPNNGQSFPSGRREINWDGVPDNFSEPNNFPVDFFNNNSPRGIMFNSVEDATGSALNQFAVSASAASGVPVRFGNLNSSYTSILQTFSSQRLFIARNTHIMEVTFFIPGTSIPAAVKGFGVVFADVDSATGGNRSLIRVYGANGRQLSAAAAPVHNNGLSFVGISFNNGESIARVVIESGNAALSATNDDGENGIDIVAMDDFIYGEPQSIDFASSVSGSVIYGATPANQPAKFVPGARLVAAGDSGAVAISNSAGSYQFNENLETGGAYTVTPSKTGDINNISPFDATLILRCVAAGNSCDLTANQQTAGDTNGSGDLSPFDATQILRFVAANGQTAQTGQTGNWKFSEPSRSYSPLSGNVFDENYTALLIGDVSGGWEPPAFSSAVAEAKQEETETPPRIRAEDSSAAFADREMRAVQEQTESGKEVGEIKGINAGDEQSTKEKADIQLSLPENVYAGAGSVITIPIYLANTANKQISAYRFAVRFDPNVLQPEATAIETADSLSGSGFSIVSDTNTKGRIGIAGSAINNSMTNSGTLLYLRFRVIGSVNGLSNASSALSFETAKKGNNIAVFEEESGNRISLSIANGSFFRK